jgi:DNA-binding NtrC family response regulator
VSTVLIVEDEPGLRQGLVDVVTGMGLSAVAVGSLGEGRRSLESQPVDCVLLDIRLRDGDGLDFLRELRAGPARDVPVIVATAYGDSERTIRAMRDGAFDYLTKPFDLPLLRTAVLRATKQRELSQAADASSRLESEALSEVPGGNLSGRNLPGRNLPGRNLIGTSAAMLQVWKLIGRAAASTAPVLITGETGTGKELVARAIHAYSPRADQPFVAINLAALPPTLIESELFGHERGAFTGALGRRSGRFETAAGGTLFLDEIGDLDSLLQTKLLRSAQGADPDGGGTYERVGGNQVLRTEARLIAATNRLVRPGTPGSTLREDLYYRLAVLEIEVPPLRARRSDIPQLVSHALAGTPARAVSEEVMARLLAYAWPGNIRELFHVVQRAAVLCGGEVIDVVDLPEPALATPHDDGGGDLSLHGAVARLEKTLIMRALERTKGNRSAAARLLSIGRPLLYAKLEEHQIVVHSPDAGDSETE